MKLSTKLSLLFLAIMLAFGGVSYYAVSRFQHDILLDEVSLNMVDDARAGREAIERLLESGVNDVEYLSTHRTVVSGTMNPAQIRDLLKRFIEKNPEYVSASYFDMGRVKIATAGRELGKIGERHELNNYWPAVYQGREGIVNVAISSSLKVPTVHFVNPVRDERGKSVGVIVLRAPVAELIGPVLMAPSLDTRKASYRADLLDGKGMVIYSSHDPNSVLSKMDRDLPALDRGAMDGIAKRGYHFSRKKAAGGNSGHDRLIAYAGGVGADRLNGEGWVLKIDIPAGVALQSVRVLEERVAGLMVFVTLLALAASLFAIMWMVVRPLRYLGDAMRQVGRGELESKLPVRSNDEIGRLFRKFNSMSSSLHEMHMELDQAVAEARAASQVKSDFLANMSHEIRTPMNAIIGLTTLCQQTGLTPQQQDYLHKIRTSSQALLRIINDILDISKIEAGKMDIERVHFTLGEVLDNLATVTVDKSGDKGLELLLDTSLDVPFNLMGDPLRLGQVLLNLTSNAIKFTQKGEVLVRVEVEGESREDVVLKFSVIDTGVGMTTEQIDNLFRPFVQADTSITRRFGGTGLGLSISKNLVELMGGRIGVKSTPGKGSTFAFTARFGKVESRTGKHVALPAVDLQGKRLLVVDDNDSSRHIQRGYLERYAGEVVLTASGADALESIRRADEEGRGGYDLVLLDYSMPEMDGIETAQRIVGASHSGKRPKILLLGQARDDERLQRALEEGLVGGILSKPFHQAQLLKAAMRAIQEEGGERTAPYRSGIFDFERGKSLSGARLLLVEDNRINQQVARELLEKFGIEIAVANHGQEALDLLAQEAYDGVLMDMQMPVMDGITATREIRKQARFAELPVIAMTANAMLKDREACLDAGMNDYIDKPIDLDKMIATLGRWIAPARPAELSRPAESVERQVESAVPEGIPGVNVDEAMRRVGGGDFYFRILGEFRRDQADVADRMRKALEAGDMQSGVLLAHTLKGLLGMAGAERLQQRAAELERAFMDGDAKGAEALIAQLGGELALLFEAIDRHPRSGGA